MDSAEVIVGVDDDRGELVACDRAVRRRTAVDAVVMAASGRVSGLAMVRRMKRESRRS